MRGRSVQSYDPFIKFYFEHRSSNIEIVDYVAKGGDTIEMNVRTLWPLMIGKPKPLVVLGQTTVAQYMGNGIMRVQRVRRTYHYQKRDNVNRRYNREIRLGTGWNLRSASSPAVIFPAGRPTIMARLPYIVGEGICALVHKMPVNLSQADRLYRKTAAKFRSLIG